MTRTTLSGCLLCITLALALPACDGAAPAGDAADTAPDSSFDSFPDSAPPDTDPPDCIVAPDPLDPPIAPSPPSSTDYLVIVADPLLSVAQDLASLRRTTGHTVEVLPMSEVARLPDGSPDLDHYPDRIRAAVAARRDALDRSLPLLVLLFGDAGQGWDGDTAVVPSATWLDPGHWVDEITSDNLYADLDGDNLPDAAVGRVPARTVEEARGYLAAVTDYESRYEPGPWNRTIHVFASEGGFGDLLDDVLLDVGMRVIGEVPPEWSVTFTYAAQSSPYTFPPASFSDRIYDYLNDGGFLMAYIGHGSPSGFTEASWDDGPSGPIFDTTRLAEIDIAHRPPLLVFIACSTGSFDTGDSISERVLRRPDSSPAILSSTEVSHPYSNTIFVREVERVAMFERPRTLGDLFLRAKRAMIERDDDLRDFMDDLAALQLTPEEIANLPAAHLHMYTLLGDPGLVLPFPRGTVDVTVEDDRLPPGDVVRFCAQVHGPPAGTAHVTFEIERTELARPSASWSLDDEGWDDTVVANHESANDKVVWSADVPYENGGFGLAFVVPPETRRYDHHVVVYADDGTTDALGQTLVRVRLE
ncbi:MAG: hypothetical protein HY907_10795 [Deltaproteobacteria bacterium]|nr:hypothetical protein [Deltaproteobacteria bacterium]